MIILKTVLKSGGEYKPEHVLRMQDMLDRYVDCPAKFVCYSDIKIEGVEVRPLLHNWPAWWSKIEIFRDVENSFYIDLDMTIQGNITDIVSYDTKNDIACPSNFTPRISGISSSIMSWSDDLTHIYKNFLQDTDNHIKNNIQRGSAFWGDQGYIFRQINSFDNLFNIFGRERISMYNKNKNADILAYCAIRKPWGVSKGTYSYHLKGWGQ